MKTFDELRFHRRQGNQQLLQLRNRLVSSHALRDA
jgi:hypothetical protein